MRWTITRGSRCEGGFAKGHNAFFGVYHMCSYRRETSTRDVIEYKHVLFLPRRYGYRGAIAATIKERSCVMTQVGLPLLTLENSTEETQHASGLDSPPHDAYGENQSPLEGQGESTQLSKLVVDTRRDGSPGTRP